MNFIKIIALFWIVACFESNGMLTTAVQKNFGGTCGSIGMRSLFIGATQNGFSNKQAALLHSQQFSRSYSFPLFKKESMLDKIDNTMDTVASIGWKVASVMSFVAVESLVTACATFATCSAFKVSKEVIGEITQSKDKEN